jgi:hypothetical protein
MYVCSNCLGVHLFLFIFLLGVAKGSSEYIVTDMKSSHSQENIGTLGSAHRRCVQPLDEKSIWEFFVPAACEHGEGHRLHSSWECDANEGIPPCLGARLSRGLGDSDFCRIDTKDLYASAAADARLAQVFALLRKPIEETLNREVPLAAETGYQLVQPRPCAGMHRTAAQPYASKDASTPLPHDINPVGSKDASTPLPHDINPVGSPDFRTSSMPKDNSVLSQYCKIVHTPKETGILKMRRRRSCEPNASELLSRTSSTASNSSTSLKVAPLFQPSMYPPSPIPAVVFNNVFSVHKFRSEKRQFRSHDSRQSCAG